jgi:hypothetical protein
MTVDELTASILHSEDLAEAIVRKFIDLNGKQSLSLSLSLSLSYKWFGAFVIGFTV